MTEKVAVTFYVSAEHFADIELLARRDFLDVANYVEKQLVISTYGLLRAAGLGLPAGVTAATVARRPRKSLGDLLPEVWRKCKGRCAYCQTELDPFEGWHMDHVIPRARGGGDELENLVASCGPCNREKHSSTVADFAARRRA